MPSLLLPSCLHKHGFWAITPALNGGARFCALLSLRQDVGSVPRHRRAQKHRVRVPVHHRVHHQRDGRNLQKGRPASASNPSSSHSETEDSCDEAPSSAASDCERAVYDKCKTAQAFSIIGVLSTAAAAGLAVVGGLGMMKMKVAGVAGACAASFGGESSLPFAPNNSKTTTKSHTDALPHRHRHPTPAQAPAQRVCVHRETPSLRSRSCSHARPRRRRRRRSRALTRATVTVTARPRPLPALRSVVLPHHLRNLRGLVQRRPEC